jgi:hypothetical protein
MTSLMSPAISTLQSFKLSISIAFLYEDPPCLGEPLEYIAYTLKHYLSCAYYFGFPLGLYDAFTKLV